MEKKHQIEYNSFGEVVPKDITPEIKHHMMPELNKFGCKYTD